MLSIVPSIGDSTVNKTDPYATDLKISGSCKSLSSDVFKIAG